jgi:hypothetical protein
MCERLNKPVGRLKRDVSVTGDENILYWFDLDNNSLICPYMQLKEILVI